MRCVATSAWWSRGGAVLLAVAMAGCGTKSAIMAEAGTGGTRYTGDGSGSGTDASGQSDAGADRPGAGGADAGGAGIGGAGAGGMGAGGAATGGTGAGGAGIGGSAGHDAGSADVQGDAALGPGICGVYRFAATAQPIDLFIVLDRSASMATDFNDMPVASGNLSKWNQVVPELTDRISSSPGSGYWWGLKAFPENGAQCAPNSVTNAIDVPLAAMNGTAVNNAILALAPTGNGTPTSAAIGVAAAYLATLTDANPRYLMLVTDGAPNCTGSSGSVVLDPNNAVVAAVNAVSAAATAGYHTFVVGVGGGGSATQNAVLNQLALAGLEAVQSANPLSTRYYQASDRTSLDLALQAITGTVLGCVLPLSSPPPAPDNVTVTLDGQVIAPDPSHAEGWDYTDSRSVAVQLYGLACSAFRAHTFSSVEIDLACSPLPSDGGADARDAGTM
jgi:hypothetical protein